jgi:4,5-dihydroxyphthalate decarboxylase
MGRDQEMSDKIVLRTLLAEKDWNRPLRSGALASRRIEFDFVDAPKVTNEFKPMVREHAYDCGELAIVTFLQARAAGKPLVLLPVVVNGGFHHKSFAYNVARGPLTFDGLAGKRIGVRTYSQTTATWVRGILQNDYGANLDEVTWVTFEDAHTAEYRDPNNCERAQPGQKLTQMLLEGELDAGVMGSDMPVDARLRTLIADPESDAAAWAQKYDVYPINHMFVVSRELCENDPESVREIYRLMAAARALKPAGFPLGFDGNWKALELACTYAFQQRLIPSPVSVDALFAEAAAVLGA